MRRLAVIALSSFVTCCTPVKTTRIGPPVPPRAKGCEVALLEKGEKPKRPYREIGMVTLENCQDYKVQPCRKWLDDAVCALGGTIAYPVQETSVRGNPAYYQGEGRTTAGSWPMTYQIMVAVYLSDLFPDSSAPLYLATEECPMPCSDKERCEKGKCVEFSAEPCDMTTEGKTEREPSSQRCME